MDQGAGDEFSVEVDGTTYELGTDSELTYNSNDGTWTLNLQSIPALDEGTYEVTATITNGSSNEVDSNSNELIIDITDPPIPVVNSLTTNNTSPTLTGTAVVNESADDSFSVTVDGTTYVLGQDSELLLNQDNTWQLALEGPIGVGTYSVTATVTDAAGNTSDDGTSSELVIELVPPPVIPTVNHLTTNDSTPILTGTATLDAGDILTVTVNGVTYTEGDGNLSISGTNWSLQIPDGNEIVSATYDVNATTTDSAGNATSHDEIGALIVDTILPVVPTVDRMR